MQQAVRQMIDLTKRRIDILYLISAWHAEAGDILANDAMNSDFSKKKKKKDKAKQNKPKTTQFSSCLSRSTHSSGRAALLIHKAMLQGCCLSAGCQLPRSVSLLPRAALVSFLGRGDD